MRRERRVGAAAAAAAASAAAWTPCCRARHEQRRPGRPLARATLRLPAQRPPGRSDLRLEHRQLRVLRRRVRELACVACIGHASCQRAAGPTKPATRRGARSLHRAFASGRAARSSGRRGRPSGSQRWLAVERQHRLRRHLPVVHHRGARGDLADCRLDRLARPRGGALAERALSRARGCRGRRPCDHTTSLLGVPQRGGSWRLGRWHWRRSRHGLRRAVHDVDRASLPAAGPRRRVAHDDPPRPRLVGCPRRLGALARRAPAPGVRRRGRPRRPIQVARRAAAALDSGRAPCSILRPHSTGPRVGPRRRATVAAPAALPLAPPRARSVAGAVAAHCVAACGCRGRRRHATIIVAAARRSGSAPASRRSPPPLSASLPVLVRPPPLPRLSLLLGPALPRCARLASRPAALRPGESPLSAVPCESARARQDHLFVLVVRPAPVRARRARPQPRSARRYPHPGLARRRALPCSPPARPRPAPPPPRPAAVSCAKYDAPRGVYSGSAGAVDAPPGPPPRAALARRALVLRVRSLPRRPPWSARPSANRRAVGLPSSASLSFNRPGPASACAAEEEHAHAVRLQRGGGGGDSHARDAVRYLVVVRLGTSQWPRTPRPRPDHPPPGRRTPCRLVVCAILLLRSADVEARRRSNRRGSQPASRCRRSRSSHLPTARSRHSPRVPPSPSRSLPFFVPPPSPFLLSSLLPLSLSLAPFRGARASFARARFTMD